MKTQLIHSYIEPSEFGTYLSQKFHQTTSHKIKNVIMVIFIVFSIYATLTTPSFQNHKFLITIVVAFGGSMALYVINAKIKSRLVNIFEDRISINTSGLKSLLFERCTGYEFVEKNIDGKVVLICGLSSGQVAEVFALPTEDSSVKETLLEKMKALQIPHKAIVP